MRAVTNIPRHRCRHLLLGGTSFRQVRCSGATEPRQTLACENWSIEGANHDDIFMVIDSQLFLLSECWDVSDSDSNSSFDVDLKSRC